VDEQEGNFKEILSQGTVKMMKLKMYLHGATCCGILLINVVHNLKKNFERYFEPVKST
jgi:hypothetical protein